ncbi:MAG: extracellular solute-binding protein [Oscillospiraceae bacterium]|nr:extracellular solute-binding protein [Oscillospiraceae bacterium]
MTNIKKTAAMLAALSICMSTAACSSGNSGDTPSVNTEATTSVTTEATEPKVLDEEDAQKVEEIDMGVEEENPEVGTVKWLSFWDLNPANGKPKSVELELFETKYGGKIEYIPTTYETRYSDLSTNVLGGTSPDLFPAADLDTFPGKAVNGMFDPFDDYLDFSTDEWTVGAKKLSDMHMLGGKHYVSVVSTDAGCVCIYNKKVVEENGLTDPAELLEEGKWDWNAFKDMCTEFSDPDNGKYGFDGWWFEINFILTTGVPVVTVEDGIIKSNINSEEMERCENFMLDMARNNIPLPHAQFDWKEQPSRVSEGLTLFYPVGIWQLYETDLSAFGEDGDIMFVPMPKDPEADKYYLPSGVDAYALCKGAPNPEGAAAFMRCKLAAVKDPTGQEIAEKQYREDYGWTDEMVDMWYKTKELTNENPVIDFYAGCSQDIYQVIHDPIKSASYNAAEWSTTRETISGVADELIGELNEQIKANF